MNRKKVEKIISILIILVMLICTVSTLVFAADEDFVPSKVTGVDSEAETESFQKLGQTVFAVIRTAGILISVIMLVCLGIKYMMGSVEEKSEYKKTLMPYVIGALLIFAASVLAQMLYNLFSTIKV